MLSHATNNETGVHLENPILLALDVDSAEQALALAARLKGKIGGIKLGPRLSVRYGADLISKIAATTPVFVDNKYLDIPNTMEAAIRATFDAGATLTTIHAWAGREALERLAKVERELNAKRPFKILTVTILTSFSDETLPPGLKQNSMSERVEELADLALQSGLTGLVCSPHEVAALRAKANNAYLVTPGVRMPTDDVGDQKRVETPAAALKLGASALVIGRPIYEAKDPVAATEKILESLRAGN